MTQTPTVRTRFEAVNSFRGLASIMVAVFHFPAIFFGADSPLVRHAYILTNMFFGLSGFILMAAYGDKLHSVKQYATFVQQRLVRLYPLYFLATVMVLCVPFLTYATNLLLTFLFTGGYAGGFSYPPLQGRELLGDLFMLQGMGLFDSLHLNFPAWSMVALFQCSVLFGALTYLRKGRLVAFIAIVAGSMYVLSTKAPFLMGSSFDYGIFRCASSFFAGAITWHVWKAWSPGVRSRQWAVLFQSGAIAIALWYITVVGIATPLTLLAPLVWSIFILAFSVDAGDYAAVLRHPRFIWLSDRSFAMFLCHASLLFIGHQTTQWLTYFKVSSELSTLVGTVSLFGYLGALLLVSDWAHRHIELPLTRRRLINSGPQGPAQAGAQPA